LVLAPDDKLPDSGVGKIDLFEYLKYAINNIYDNLNYPNYLDFYFCFERRSPFKAENKHINIEIYYK